jgi:Putative ABC exporter
VNTAKVLWYLWFRQIVNGIKRAVSSPRRLISVLIGLGYYVGFFMRPWDRSTSLQIEKGFAKDFHVSPQTIETVVFIAFMIVSIFFALAIFGFRNTFKQADVDVLFPTPISTKVVMFFRLFRDYAVTLFLPLLIALFTFQLGVGAFNAVKKNDPQALNILIRSGLVAWILLSLAWISISYAMCFFVAKNEKRSRLITNSVGFSIFIVMVVVFGSIWFQMRANPSFQTMIEATSAPWLRAIMFIPSAATAIVVGGFNGSTLYSIGGAVVFIALIIGCLTYSANLSNWMYDQAATKGFQGQAMKDFQRKGDMMSVAAERARTGNFGKNNRLAKKVSNWNFRKGWTLIYKEMLIQSRIGFWVNLVFVIAIAGFGIMFLLLPVPKSGVQVGSYLYLGLTGFMAVNMGSMQSYSGFVETLKRVEVMKPLPLTSAQIAFYETMSKAFVSMFMSFTPFVVGLIYKPSLWQFHVSGMIAAPSLSLALVSAIFLIVVLFPDFDDPTQRSFRGIMQLIAMVVIMGPTAITFIGFAVLGWSPIIPAIICLGINLGITALLTSIAGRFYADFNPSE